MNDIRKRLEELLGRRVETVGDAELAARAAEALAAYIRLADHVESILGDEPVSASGVGKGLDGLPLHDAARRVLDQAGVPLHVRELGKRIKAGGWKHRRSRNPRPDQIQFQLAARLPRHPDTFLRVAPNTFGLAEWGRRSTERRKPRLPLFAGEGKPTGREIGELEDAAAGGPWRSS
jgi:hypothetical protein